MGQNNGEMIDFIEKIREIKRKDRTTQTIIWDKEEYKELYYWLVERGFDTPIFGEPFNYMGIKHYKK